VGQHALVLVQQSQEWTCIATWLGKVYWWWVDRKCRTWEGWTAVLSGLSLLTAPGKQWSSCTCPQLSTPFMLAASLVSTLYPINILNSFLFRVLMLSVEGQKENQDCYKLLQKS